MIRPSQPSTPQPHVVAQPSPSTRGDTADSKSYPSVLFFSSSGDYYGAPRSLFLLATGLRSRGVSVQVAVPADGVLADKLRSAGIRVWVGPCDPYLTSPVGSSRPAKVIRRLRWGIWAVSVILRARPAIVYINTLRGATVAVAAHILRVPVIWHLRGLESGTGNRFYRRLRLKLVAFCARRIVAVSRAVAVSAEAAGCPASRLLVAYNGIDADAVSRDAHEQIGAVTVPTDFADRVVVAYVGRLDPHKGILEFLDAARRIGASHGQVAFLLIGGPVGAQNSDWTQIGPALDTARAAGATIHITGFTDQPYGYMQRADVLVLPSHDEGFPRAVLEAMALRKPIVATAVGGVPEAITDEEHGLLIPARDSQRLTLAVTRLARDSELRNALGGAARSRVARDFSVEVATEVVLGILHPAVAP